MHTTTIIDVDYYEKNKNKAYSVNVISAKNLCKTAKKLISKIIYILTDGVFSGQSKNNK